MPTNILMPALSPTMEKGNLARWLKKEGDKIKSGDVIAEIETDKATMEYEAVDEGTLAKIVVPEGTQDVAVNAVIAVLAGEGEDVKAAAQRAKAAPAAAKAAEALRTPAAAGRSPRVRRRTRRSRAASLTLVLRRRRSAARRRQAERPRQQSHLLLAARAPSGEGSRHRSQSRAGLRSAWPRHRARHRRGEIRQGPARAGRCALPPVARSLHRRCPTQQIRALYEDGCYDFVPHDGMRRTIAQRLTHRCRPSRISM